MSEAQKMANELLGELKKSRVNFDPSFDHQYGTKHPQKVAFVPKELFEEVCYFLGNLK